MLDPWGASHLAGVLADVFAQADPGTNPITGWASLGVSGLFIGAWWIERKDRKEADERQRSAFERVFSVVETLERAIDVVEKAGKGGA